MRARIAVAALLVGALVGCAAPPTAELDEVRSQLAAAEEAEAGEYAADVFGEAKKLLADAEAEVARQQQAFAPGRSYDAAREMIAAALAKAKQAAESAVKVKAMVGEQLADHLADLQAGLGTGRELIERLRNCRRRSWREKVDLDESTVWMDDMEKTIGELQGAVDSGALKSALADAQTAVEDLGQQLSGLESAATDSGC